MKNNKTIDTLEDALYALLHRSEMPAKAQAELLGVSYTRLSNSCHESSETAFHHTRFIIPQTLATRNFVLLDYLERRCGRVAFSLPEIAVPEEQEQYRKALMGIAFELGGAVGAIEDGLKDNDFRPGEKARGRQEVFDVVMKAMALYKMLED